MIYSTLKIKIDCEIRDENDIFLEKKLGIGYDYNPTKNNWSFEAQLSFIIL